jgi:hypothetical protein
VELRDRLVKLSQEKEIHDWYYKPLDETFYFVKLNTKDGTKYGRTLEDEDIIAKILISTMCDIEGALLFKRADLNVVNAMPIDFTSEAWKQALIYNKMLPEEKDSTPEKESVKN